MTVRSTPLGSADRRRWFVWAAVGVGTVALGLWGLPKLDAAQGRGEAVPAPLFNLPVVHGGELGARQNLADLKGKVVVVDFWASWCGPCEAQAQQLRELQQQLPDGVTILAINTDEEAAVAESYARSRQLPYTVLSDADGSVAAAYGVRGLPTLAVVSPQGVLAHLHTGVASLAQLRSLVADARSL